ncbi:hypothetical protein GCM10009552_30240 [Rothia nasimurium]|uniref:Uncharacterized protein n=1 Tax=Luteibacter anthropi TaxID=564369 RepID=A0A7X5ZIE4_9GAMM|nr:hypothetical protein [Luteibacter anthropi]NII06787.1 hypothetical protein [Luteibacter anthropi]
MPNAPAPYLPAKTEFGGINNGAISPYPGSGAWVQISSSTLQKSDVISVYWADANAPVIIEPLQDDPNVAVTLHVPGPKISPYPGTVDVWYTIYRPLTPETILSDREPVLVKFTIPGGPDPNPATPNINENLAAIPELRQPIPPNVDLIITIPAWLNMTVGDKLHLEWGSYAFPVIVIGTDSPVGQNVRVTVPWTIIAGTDNGMALVTYHIFDVVRNHSLWAPPALADSGVNRFNAPLLPDAANGAIELKPGMPAVRVWVIDNRIQAGDSIILYSSGKRSDGTAVDPVTATLNATGALYVEFTMQASFLEQLTGGELIQYYTVSRNGQQLGRSDNTETRITGQVGKLPKPIVDPVDANNIIHPLTTTRITVSVSRSVAFQQGDILIVRWKAATQDGSREVENRFPWQDPSVAIDTAVLPYSFGGSVDVSYVIERGSQKLESESETVFVARIADGDPFLPRPRSPQENPAGTLNLALFPGDAAFTVDQFRFADASQRYWLTLEGRDSNGGAVTWNIAEGEAFGSLSNPITLRSLDRTRLASLADGSTMIASLWVTYDGSPNKANAVKFRTTSFTIRQAAAQRPPAPTVVQADANGKLVEPWKLTKLQVHIPSAVGLQPGDQLRVYWNTGGNAGSDEVLITAPTAGMNVDIKLSVLAHNLGNVIPVKYAIIRGSQTLESITANISVADLPDDQDELGRPKVTQEDATGHIIDLSTFKGDADVIIATYPMATASQRYWLTASVEFAIGGRQDVDIVKGATVPYTGGPTISLGKLDRTLLDSLKGGSILTLTLWVSFNESANKNDAIRFRKTDYSIQLQESLKLLLPVVDRATGSGSVKNTLDPGDLIDSQGVAHRINITLPKENGFKAGDTITLYWEDNTPQGSRTVVVPTVFNQDIAVLVDSDVMRFNHGHVVEVYFTVKRDGKDHNSPTLRLTVKRIPGNTTKFRRATIKQQDGLYDLNLSKFKGDGTLQIEPFAWLVSGMYYWIEVRGRDKNGETKKYIEKTFNSVSGPQIYLGDVDRKWLETLIDQSPFWIDIWVSFDGSKVKRDAVAFRSTNYTLKHK